MAKSPNQPTDTPAAPSSPAAGGFPVPAVKKRAQEYAAEKDWKGYFGAVLGKPPRETLLAALDLFDKDAAKAQAAGGAGVPPAGSPRFAIDLGCGEGRDTLELLRRGLRVLAIDASPEAFGHLLPRVPQEQRPNLETRVATMEQLELPRCDLLNASYALPFCAPDKFESMWRKVVASVRVGGRLAGQLFGDRDDWARCGDRCHFPRSQVERMYEGFVWESFREEEHDESDSSGVKHWHVFHIVARKL
jgi:SAM-dependent methyltransferase